MVQPSPAPLSVSRVRRPGARLVLALVSRPAEALLVSAPVPARQVGTAAALLLHVPAPRVRAAVNQLSPASVPAPWVGAASVWQVPVPVPVSVGGEPVQQFPSL